MTLYIATDWYDTMLFATYPKRTENNGGEWGGYRVRDIEERCRKDILKIAKGQTWKDEPIKVELEIKLRKL